MTGRRVAVVLAAGSASRMGGLDKILAPLAGRPLLAWSLAACADCPAIDEILVVTAPERVARYRDEVLPALGHGAPAAVDVIAGGATRHASECAAIDYLAARIERGEVGLVLIHDAARPLVTPALIARVVDAAERDGAVVPALRAPPATALVEIDDHGASQRLLPAARVWYAQTPQGFEAHRLLDACRRAQRAGFDGTDTASALEFAGYPVRLVPGDPDNLKVTHPRDLAEAASRLLARAGGAGSSREATGP